MRGNWVFPFRFGAKLREKGSLDHIWVQKKRKIETKCSFLGYKWGKNGSLLRFLGIEMGKLSSPQHFRGKTEGKLGTSVHFLGYK